MDGAAFCRPWWDSPLYTTKNNGDVPYLDAVMVECDDGSLSLFAVNKSLEDDITLACDLRQYEASGSKGILCWIMTI